ncbi:disease resistance protein RGA2-like [Papaver somniferum]|uniref:disease resistance protein RGA2-like n=1 Tax=Papaver somniferum TaxID=3469 RepID=UPI000E6F67E3|nr:disease resistance protein RGA2-like [Papaver somniferum]
MPVEKIAVGAALAVLKPLISAISEETKRAWGVGEKWSKLGRTLEAIEDLFASAADEEGGKNLEMEKWLQKLQFVVYDIQDVMDDFSYQSKHYQKHKVKALLSLSNPALFAFQMSRKISLINGNLDEIHRNCEHYKVKRAGTTYQNNQTSAEYRNRLESSHGRDPEVFGREKAVREILQFMNQTVSPSLPVIASSDETNSVSTLSIVGMGGLGKTVVAKLVYKDAPSSFELKSWVCLSEIFDVYKILGQIVQSITGKHYDDPSNVHYAIMTIHQMSKPSYDKSETCLEVNFF